MVVDTSHTAAIMDVFEAFLSTDNPVVFAHAALNCVTCLIKYIKGSMEQRELEELVDIRELIWCYWSKRSRVAPDTKLARYPANFVSNNFALCGLYLFN